MKEGIPILDEDGILGVGYFIPGSEGQVLSPVQMVVKRNFIFSTDSYQPDSIKAQDKHEAVDVPRNSLYKVQPPGNTRISSYFWATRITSDSSAVDAQGLGE